MAMKRRTLFLAVMGALGAPTAEPKPQVTALPKQREWAGNGDDWACYGLESIAGPATPWGILDAQRLVYSHKGGFDAIGYSEARRQPDGTFKVTREWTVKRPGT